MALGMRSRELHGHAPRPRRVLCGGSVAALAAEAGRRPSSFTAGTSITACRPPVLTVGMVEEAALALHYKSEQSKAVWTTRRATP